MSSVFDDWTPATSIQVSFSDETAEDRGAEELETMVQNMRAVARRYGFDIQTWSHGCSLVKNVSDEDSVKEQLVALSEQANHLTMSLRLLQHHKAMVRLEELHNSAKDPEWRFYVYPTATAIHDEAKPGSQVGYRHEDGEHRLADIYGQKFGDRVLMFAVDDEHRSVVVRRAAYIPLVKRLMKFRKFKDDLVYGPRKKEWYAERGML